MLRAEAGVAVKLCKEAVLTWCRNVKEDSRGCCNVGDAEPLGTANTKGEDEGIMSIGPRRQPVVGVVKV